MYRLVYLNREHVRILAWHKIYSTTYFVQKPDTETSFIFIVGGGMIFSSAGVQNQALALGLIPAGTAPVAVFPPTPDQSVQAFSVIFSESLTVNRRGKRSDRTGKFYKARGKSFEIKQRYQCIL